MAREKRTVDTKAVNSATEVLTQIAQLATIRLDDAKLAKIVGDPTNDGLYPVHIQSSEDPTATVCVANATPYIPEVNDECYVYCVDNNPSSATAFIIQIKGKDGNFLQKLFTNQINEALANWTAPTSSTSSTSGPSIVDTWRPVQVNGASWKNTSTGSGALNFKAGTNISLSYSGNDLTISATGGSVTDTWRPVRVNGSQILTNDPTTGALGVGIANGSEDILTLTTSTESWGKNAKLSIDIDGTYFDSNSDDGLTLQSSWVNTLATQTWVSNQHYLTQHQTVTNSGPTLAWGQTSTVGSVGGTALTVTMPSDPIPTLPQQATDEGKVIKYLGMGGYGWDFVAWSEITGTPTIPTITLNGSTTTTPSFYAPSGAGTANQILLWDGINATPTWANQASLTPGISCAATPTASAFTSLIADTKYTLTIGASTWTFKTATELPSLSGASDGDVLTYDDGSGDIIWAPPPGGASIASKLGTASYYIKAENGNEINFYSTSSLPNNRIQFGAPQSPLVGDRKNVGDYLFGGSTTLSSYYYGGANIHAAGGYFNGLMVTDAMGAAWIDVVDVLENKTLPTVTASDAGKTLVVTSGGFWTPTALARTGGGYTFTTATQTGGSITGRILGTAVPTNVYGWHTFEVDPESDTYEIDGSAVANVAFTNASILVITSIYCRYYDGGTYRLCDGTLVDTYAKLQAAVNKLGYLEMNTTIDWSD